MSTRRQRAAPSGVCWVSSCWWSWSAGDRLAWWVAAMTGRMVVPGVVSDRIYPLHYEERSPRWPRSTISTRTWWQRWRGPRAASTPTPCRTPGPWGSCSSCPRRPSGSRGSTAGRDPTIPTSPTRGQPGVGRLLPGLPAATSATIPAGRVAAYNAGQSGAWMVKEAGGSDVLRHGRHPLSRDAGVRRTGGALSDHLPAGPPERSRDAAELGSRWPPSVFAPTTSSRATSPRR